MVLLWAWSNIIRGDIFAGGRGQFFCCFAVDFLKGDNFTVCSYYVTHVTLSCKKSSILGLKPKYGEATCQQGRPCLWPRPFLKIFLRWFKFCGNCCENSKNFTQAKISPCGMGGLIDQLINWWSGKERVVDKQQWHSKWKLSVMHIHNVFFRSLVERKKPRILVFRNGMATEGIEIPQSNLAEVSDFELCALLLLYISCGFSSLTLAHNVCTLRAASGVSMIWNVTKSLTR